MAPRPAPGAPGRSGSLLTGHLLHVPHEPAPAADASPSHASGLEAIFDGALLVRGGRIVDLGPAEAVRARHPDAPVEASGGWILPGFVDGHVHYPQLPVMGAMGLRLLEWLQERTLPHEERFADAAFARDQARIFLRTLARNGTTTALVFGAHQASAMDAFFGEAGASGLRIAAGLALGDRELTPALHTTPERALRESTSLMDRWHGRGRLRYAVTPRFSLSASDTLLAACGDLLGAREDLLFTTHLNETPEEVAYVRRLFPSARDYLETYEAHGLVGPHSVFAHDVHPTDGELERLAASGAVVCHCASSNGFIGSGLFPMRRHLRHRVRLMLGTDVGGGTSFSLLAEAREAYRAQMLLGTGGARLDAARLLWLATAGGAAALGLGDEVGDLQVDKAADLVVLRPAPSSTLAERLRHAADADDAAAAMITLGTEADVARTLVAGEAVWDARDAAPAADGPG